MGLLFLFGKKLIPFTKIKTVYIKIAYFNKYSRIKI